MNSNARGWNISKRVLNVLTLILEDSKSGAIRRPKYLIALGFLS